MIYLGEGAKHPAQMWVILGLLSQESCQICKYIAQLTTSTTKQYPLNDHSSLMSCPYYFFKGKFDIKLKCQKFAGLQDNSFRQNIVVFSKYFDQTLSSLLKTSAKFTF